MADPHPALLRTAAHLEREHAELAECVAEPCPRCAELRAEIAEPERPRGEKQDALTMAVRSLRAMAEHAGTARGASWEHGARSQTTLVAAVEMLLELEAKRLEVERLRMLARDGA